MLLISAMLMGTSTYAWFSMNTTVTATGMSVTAKSDAASLVINTSATFDPSGTAYTANAHANATLLPVAHGSVSGGVGTPSAISDAGDMTNAAKWYYAYSDKNDASTAKPGTAVACTSLTNYVASSVFSAGLNEKADDAAKGTNLGVSKVTITADAAITVVVVCGTNVHTFTAANNGTVSGKILAAEVTKTGVEIDVYYYIDGNNEKVYTNNLQSLTGTIELEFSLESVTNG